MTVTLDWFCASDFSELDSCINTLKGKGGIYIWIFKGTPARVAYVGECADFIKRFREHISCQISGQYLGFDADPKEDFILQFLKNHYIGKNVNEIITSKKVYFPIPNCDRAKIGDYFSFKRFWSDNIIEINLTFLKNLRFIFCTVSSNIERKEIEAALLIGLRVQYCKILRIKEGYFKLSDYGNSNNTPLGNISKYPKDKSFTIEHKFSEGIDLPAEIANIKHYPFQDT